ncbi:LolA family protein [Desulfovibrio inopinatus]|uniref:LolA family protein n=1 Tax=Desulfovibrio inopinatus TaxID=102109 RepID=UPI000409556C|nr:outer membrane lipoprotein carrier protein LolA [Desulfovibrio inopinatus]
MNIVFHLRSFFWALICVLMMNSVAGAADVDVDVKTLTDDMQKRYEALNAFTAGFVQNMTNAASGEIQQREGVIDYRRPKFLRWETTKPEKELLLIGNKVVWDAFPDEGVAYKYRTDEILDSKTMLRFLTGKANLKQDFFVEPNPTQEGDTVRLTLIPRQAEPGLIRAEAWVNPKTHLLTRIVLEDFYGNINDLSLFDLKENPKFPSDYFTFTPGKNIEVFDNTQ